MSAPAYSPALLAQFRDPTHAGSFPSGTPGVVRGEAGEEDDGRLVRLQLRLGPGRTIADARFKAFGCPATIACASYAAAALVNRTLAEAEELSAGRISADLALPDARRGAADLAVQALRAALAAAGEPP